jgi:glycosyltransferase involved in cell wall biosynthesis
MKRGVLHLAFIVPALSRGGAETQVVRMSERLVARGWRVTILVLLDRSDFDAELKAAGVTVYRCGVRGGVAGIAALPLAGLRAVRRLRAAAPDVALTFLFHGNVVGRLLARLAGVPVVISSIRSGGNEGRIRTLLEAVTGRMADLITTNSEEVAAQLIERRVARAGTLRVIPNVAPEDNAAPASRAVTRAALGVGPDQFLWVAAGALRDAKDYPTLLRAFDRLRAARPDAQLRIAGSEELRQSATVRRDLEQLIDALGVHGHCRLLGLRRDVPDLLHAADGFVLSSAWEGLPNVIIEAQLAGLPVVATCVGGVPELVTEGVTGCLAPAGDAAALAAAMHRVMAMPLAQRQALGVAARQSVRTRLDPERVMDLWEDTALELLEARGPR